MPGSGRHAGRPARADVGLRDRPGARPDVPGGGRGARRTPERAGDRPGRLPPRAADPGAGRHRHALLPHADDARADRGLPQTGQGDRGGHAQQPLQRLPYRGRHPHPPLAPGAAHPHRDSRVTASSGTKTGVHGSAARTTRYAGRSGGRRGVSAARPSIRSTGNGCSTLRPGPPPRPSTCRRCRTSPDASTAPRQAPRPIGTAAAGSSGRGTGCWRSSTAATSSPSATPRRTGRCAPCM